jgi:hypothetical protein
MLKAVSPITSNGIGVVPPVPILIIKLMPKQISFAVKPIKYMVKRIIKYPRN